MILPGVIVLFAMVRINTASIMDAKAIFNNISTDYNKELRPVDDQNNALNVSVEMYLNSIKDFDEVSGTLRVLGALCIYWNDVSLVWNPASYGGIEQISVGQNNIWLPKLYNIKASDAFSAISDSDFLVRISHDGTVSWLPGGFIDVKCSPDVSYFPFDRQTCSIQLAAWGYLQNEIRLLTPKTELFLDFYEPNGVWSLDKTTTGTSSLNSIGVAKFDITISRLPAFHIVNTLMPIYLLLVMNPLVFMLPCDSGERVGFSLTVFLTFTVFITIVNGVLPATSENMSRLSYFIFAVLVASGVIASINIFQLRMYHKDENSPVPGWLIRLVRVISCQCRKPKRRVTVVCPQNSESKTTIQNRSKNGPVIPEVGDTDNTQGRMTWKDVVRILDMFFICFSYSVITVSSIATFVSMYKGNN